MVQENFGGANIQSVYVSRAIIIQIHQTIMCANPVILVALLVMDLHMLTAQVALMMIIEFKVVKHVYVNKDFINCKLIEYVLLAATLVCIVLTLYLIHVNNVFKQIKEHLIYLVMNVLAILDILMMGKIHYVNHVVLNVKRVRRLLILAQPV